MSSSLERVATYSIVVNGVLMSFTSLAVALRVYVRVHLTRIWGLDDYLFLAAYVRISPHFQYRACSIRLTCETRQIVFVAFCTVILCLDVQYLRYGLLGNVSQIINVRPTSPSLRRLNH